MKQRGFSLIMAIFLIVVLGGIAVFIGRVSTMQHQSSALDEEGAMAYQAARSGIEWGVYQAIVVSSCVASTSFTLPLIVPTTPVSTVNYTVTVTCTRTPATEGSTVINMYQITATAINAGVGRFFVERQLTATVTQ
ncbi:pilus assembly PilX family protein [Methylobacter tundripaludum]|nr:agglutinin biogenesis protein MshP [Methylobacter tundripaludum]